jgi:asparagine synthase (glutamine-hydrolysing)
MCGIAGYYGTRELDPDAIAACLARMKRRGPDHAAFRSWATTSGRRVYLLNSRLRIVDLDDRANQPFARGHTTLTFNGEIYNHVELRDELLAGGQTFVTTSDTEVLIASLDRWGAGAWDRLEGMWAVAVFDEHDETLTLCRDRFGEKPLVFFEDETGVYFGSEPKLLSALAGRRFEPDLCHVRRFLVNGYRSLYSTRGAFLRGISEVEPGTWRRIDRDGTAEAHRYWQLTFLPDDTMPYEEAVDGVRQRLARSVALRLRADVPVAFCLSGGVDSNALVAVAARTLGCAVHAFTVVDDDPRYDERAMVRPAAAELGIRHTEVPTSHDRFVDRLAQLVGYHDGPVATISYFAHAALMEQVAAGGYRVAVSGTGADELLSGYYDHHLAYLAEMRGRPEYEAAVGAWQRTIRPLVRNPLLTDPDLFVRAPAFRDHLTPGSQEYCRFLTEPWHEALEESRFTGDGLRNRMMNELFHETVPVILHEDDLNAMYWSIENRSPYLDRSLAEFCYTIPTRHLVRSGLAKAPLRDAVRGVAPARVLDNPRKIGFNAPIASFLDTRDRAVRDWLLAGSPIYDLVRRDCMAALIDRPSLPDSDSKFLFSFVSAKMFLEQHGGPRN